MKWARDLDGRSHLVDDTGDHSEGVYRAVCSPVLTRYALLTDRAAGPRCWRCVERLVHPRSDGPRSS